MKKFPTLGNAETENAPFPFPLLSLEAAGEAGGHMECAAKGLVAEPCAGEARRRCGGCGAVAYCSRAHQVAPGENFLPFLPTVKSVQLLPF